MTLRDTVLDQIVQVARLQNQPLAPLTDDLPLMDSGLDSLSIAIIVANLEDELDLDPFGTGKSMVMPKTVGDFVRLYERCAA